MILEITVPEVAEGVHAGTVVLLAVTVGEQVVAGQTLLELETDKAVVEIPSPQAGKIDKILVKEGEKVEVGAVILVLDSAEAAPEQVESPVPDAPAKEVAAVTTVTPVAPVAPEVPVAPDEEAAVPPPLDLSVVRRGDQVAPAAPSVRRKARELGVDIYQVRGSGPGGRISESDVRHFVRDAMQRMTVGGAPARPPLPDFTRWGAISREPLTRIREVTAEAMIYAWSTIPMVTQYDQAQITAVEKYRIEHNAHAPAAARLTMTAILTKICAAALKEFPRFNSSLDLPNRELILKQAVHIGVAVDTPQGLLVPVLRDADRKGLAKLAGELNELAGRARERKLVPAEMEGGGFTISNLGGIGGQAFTPLVYAPQVAILGVSRAAMQPVWDGSTFHPELMLPLALTYDHRVIDGADGARFLRWICETIENPLELVMKDCCYE